MNDSRIAARWTLAQQSALSTALHTATTDVLDQVRPETFDDPWRGIGSAMLAITARGAKLDIANLVEECQRTGTGLPNPAGWLNAGFTSPAAAAAEDATAHGAVRVEQALIRARQRLDLSADLWETVDGLRQDLDDLDRPDSIDGDPWWTSREVLDFAHRDEPWVVPGLLAQRERLVLVGGEGHGKALALDTPLATTTGWTTMGEIRVGEQVFGADGRPTTVVAATEVMHDRECFRVMFSDGSSIVADGDHQWLTDDYWSRASRRRQEGRALTRRRGTDQRDKLRLPQVRTTREIRDTLTISTSGGCVKRSHSIQCAPSLEMPERSLPIDPYVLGVWLGDGSKSAGRITLGDHKAAHIKQMFAAAGTELVETNQPLDYRAVGLQAALRSAGILGSKHIPAEYQRASVRQRLQLLRGVMDTDGSVQLGKCTCYELTLCNERLAQDVHEMILGLGIKCTINESDAKLNGRVVGRRWRMLFQTTLDVVTLPWHLDRVQPQKTTRSERRFIVAVEPVESVPVRCIQVDNAEHLYLAGRELIATHNSQLLWQLAMCAAHGLDILDPSRRHQPARVMVLDVENSHEQQVARMVRTLHAALDPTDTAPDNLVLLKRRSIDLLRPADRQALVDAVTRWQPTLLVMGAGYKLADSSDWRDTFRAITRAADACRDVAPCAVVIETHAGHGQGEDRNGYRPDGASSWRRWPEFGHALVPVKGRDRDRRVLEVKRWRGDRVTGRAWPAGWRGGGALPWTPLTQDELDYEKGAA